MKPQLLQAALIVSISMWVTGCSSPSGLRSGSSSQAMAARPVMVHHHGSDAGTSLGKPGEMAQSSERLQGRGGPNEAALLLHEEELVVNKRTVDNGGLLLRKTVETREVQEPVELQREEYTIERISADQLGAIEGDATVFQENEIFVPLYKEVPVVDKKSKVIEWVRVNKITEIDEQTITRPLRKENVQIVRQEGPEEDEAMSSTSGAASQGEGIGAPGAIGQSSERLTATGGSSTPIRREQLQSADLALNEEELVVGKQKTENGGVILRKTVETRTGSQPIQLKREEYQINRSPANEQSVGADAFKAREIYIPLTREEPVVNTRTFVTEQLRLRKETETDQRTITDTIRREKLEIEEN